MNAVYEIEKGKAFNIRFVPEDYVPKEGEFIVENCTHLNDPTRFPMNSIESLKDDKEREINMAKFSSNVMCFPYKDKLIPCDPNHILNIHLVQGIVARTGKLPKDFQEELETMDHKLISIKTVEEWDSFYSSLVSHVMKNAKKAHGLKVKLDVARTEEEIAAITW